MTNIPRWPKVSLLDDPDEEERARQQLNENRRQRGLPPLYPESGFPPAPAIFGGIVAGDRWRDPSRPDGKDLDPGVHKRLEGISFVEGEPGEPGAGDQVAQADPPPSSSPAAGQSPGRPAPEGAVNEQAPPADKPAPPTKPLTYEQIKELVRENNRSRLPDELIIALIYKESSFNPQARTQEPGSTASGLMQVTERAWKVVHEERLNYGKGNSPNFGEHVFDPATNIQRGTAYLQHRIDGSRGDIERGLAGYGPPKEKNYVASIFDAAIALQQNPPDPIAALNQVYGRNPVRKR